MYRSWKTLLIENDQDLRSKERIRKLQNARSTITLAHIIACIVAGVASLGVAIFLGIARIYLGIFFMLVLALGFFVAARLFHKERSMDPIRNFLLKPDDFDFVKGELVSASYNSSDKRNNRKMIVQGEAKTPEGVSLLFFEFFSPDIWPFIESGSEEHLRPGDDWYDLKGSRKTLPIPVYVIFDKKMHASNLIGIDRSFLSSVLKKIE